MSKGYRFIEAGVSLLLVLLFLFTASCSNGSSQEELDKVNAETEKLQQEVDDLNYSKVYGFSVRCLED